MAQVLNIFVWHANALKSATTPVSTPSPIK